MTRRPTTTPSEGEDSMKTYSIDERLTLALQRFTIGGVADRAEHLASAAEAADVATEDLDDEDPRRMLAHTMGYAASQAGRRRALEEELLEAKDEALRLRVHEATGSIARARDRICRLLEEHDAPSEELEGLLAGLRKELIGFAGTLELDFYVDGT